MYCDLHFHTYYSTGANSNPHEVMKLMEESNCKGFASADHDALGAIPIFQEGAAAHGLEFIPGVEVSTNSSELGNMHILGYGFDPDNVDLKELLGERLAYNYELYRFALDEMIENGPIRDEYSFREYWLKDEPDKQMTIHHVSWWLVEQGHASNLKEAKAMFANAIHELELLNPMPTPQKAIETIHQAGGLAVIAHPAYGGNIQLAPKRVDYVLPFGINGIEVYTPSNGDADNIEIVRQIAESHKLFMTGGSDCHAKCANLEKWPSQAPFECFEKLRGALDEN